MKTFQTFITNNGNILNLTPENTFFTKPDGQFIRLVTKSEKDFLMSIPLPKVKIEGYQAPTEIPVWRWMWNVIESDETNFKPETGSNGGDYAYYTTAMYFARKNGAGLEWCKLELKTTSSEFGYTHDGDWVHCYDQTDIEVLGTDLDDLIYITSQTQDEYEVLDRIAEKSTYYEAMNAVDVLISKEGNEASELTEETRAERKLKLEKYFGTHAAQGRKPRRGHGRGSRRG